MRYILSILVLGCGVSLFAVYGLKEPDRSPDSESIALELEHITDELEATGNVPSGVLALRNKIHVLRQHGDRAALASR